MSNRIIQMTDKLYDYLLEVSLRESKVLAELRKETSKLPMSQMQIAPEQGQFMALLVKLISAKKTLDIGTFTGYSALVVAAALPENGKVITCDIREEWTGIAQKFWDKAGLRQKIDLQLAPALDTLEKLIANKESNTFDFAFVDADKNNYPEYYEKSLQLLRPGGLMAIDNVLQDGRVADPDCKDKITETIRQLNKKIHADKRVDISMIPIADGLTLVRKN